MSNIFYDPGVCRQFNMLGAYIAYYEKLCEDSRSGICEASPLRKLPSDCLGHVKEPTKGGDVTDSDTSSISEPDFDGSQTYSEYDDTARNDSDDDEEQIENILYDEVEKKLKDAEVTIMNLKEDFDRMNKDHFELEQLMKNTYYEDRRRSNEESSLLQQKLEEKEQQLMELSRIQEKSEQFWDERKRELNDLMNDVILNMKDMSHYQELCNIFNNNEDEECI